jgi:hypothetical protein
MGNGSVARRVVDPAATFSDNVGGWEQRVADPLGLFSGSPTAAPPVPPPPIVNDEADAVNVAKLSAQRQLASVRGFRRAFLRARGPGGPEWQAIEKDQTFTRSTREPSSLLGAEASVRDPVTGAMVPAPIRPPIRPSAGPGQRER